LILQYIFYLKASCYPPIELMGIYKVHDNNF